MPTTLTCWELLYHTSNTEPVGAIGQLNTDSAGNWTQVNVSGIAPLDTFDPPPIDEPGAIEKNVYCGYINHPPVPEGQTHWEYRVLAYDDAGVFSEPSNVGVIPVPELTAGLGLIVGVLMLVCLCRKRNYDDS